MYIINKSGVLHSIPDDWPVPEGARKATKEEIATWEKADAEAKKAKVARIAEERMQNAQFTVNVTPEEPKEAEKPARPAKT